MISVSDIKVVFGKGTPLQKQALNGVSLTIEEGQFVTVIGSETGLARRCQPHASPTFKLQTGFHAARADAIAEREIQLPVVRQVLAVYPHLPLENADSQRGFRPL